MKRVIHKPYIYYTVPLAILWFVLLCIYIFQQSRESIVNDIVDVGTRKSMQFVSDSMTIYTLDQINTWNIEKRLLSVLSSDATHDKTLQQFQGLIKEVWWIAQYFEPNVSKMYRVLKWDGSYMFDWNPVEDIIFVMYEKNPNPLWFVIVSSDKQDRLVSFYLKWYKLHVLQSIISKRLDAIYQYSIWNVTWAVDFFKSHEYAYVYNASLSGIDDFYINMNKTLFDFNIEPANIYIDDIDEEYISSITATWFRIKGDYITKSWKWYTYDMTFIDNTWDLLFLEMNINTNNKFIDYMFE